MNQSNYIDMDLFKNKKNTTSFDSNNNLLHLHQRNQWLNFVNLILVVSYDLKFIAS
jgi:hypothetical protein